MSEFFISRDEAGADVLACAAFVAERVAGGDAHAEAVSAVVPRYLARGNVDVAAEFANTVDDPFVRDRLLIAVAAKCADLDDDEYALQLADAIEEVGLQSQAREVIARIKAGKGDIETARKIANDVMHPDQVLAAIAIRQAADGNQDAATETLSEIDYPASSVVALITMASERIEKGETEKAVEYLETASVLAEEIEHDEERIRALIDVGHRFVEAERNAKAIETFDKARSFAEDLNNVHRDNLLGSVSVAFMHAGTVELADSTLDMVTDKTQISTALLGFAREYSRRGEMDDALEALDEAYEVLRSQRDTETRDSKAKFALFASIAAQFAGFEKGERAIEIAEKIEDDKQAKSALSQVAVIMTQQGKDELARQALNTISDEAQRVFALIGMHDVAAKSDAETAKGFLNEAAEAVESIPQLGPRANALNEIAARAGKAQNDELFNATLDRLLTSVSEMKGDRNKATALADLAATLEELQLESPPDLTEKLNVITAQIR
jgi:tetratricopeptide (TPR) repeat protein